MDTIKKSTRVAIHGEVRPRQKGSIVLFALMALATLAPTTPAHASTINASLSMPPNNLGLVGWWTMDGANMVSNVADSSGQGNNGNLMGGATTTVPGPVGQALLFKGANYVTVPYSASIAPIRITVSYWMKETAAPAFLDTLVTRKDDGTGISYFSDMRGTSNQSPTFGTDPGFNHLVTANSSLTVGRWYHIVGTFDGGTYRIYINGILDNALVDGTPLYTSTVPLDIGYLDLNGVSSRFFHGSIDDIRIYNRALSASEIKQIYNAGTGTHTNASLNPPNLQNGLVGWWTMDGANMVSNVADSSGQGNNGNLMGGATTTVPGEVGQALKFNGTSQYVDLGTQAAPPSMSFSVWIKPNAYPVGSAFSEPLRKESSYEISLSGTGNSLANSAVVGVKDTSDNRYEIDVPFSYIPLNTWTLITLTAVSNSYVKVYVNGVQYGSDVSFPTSIGNTSGNHIFLGTYGTTAPSLGRWFSGSVDDFRIYNRALSAQEVQQLYNLGGATHVNATVNPPNLQSGLVGHWTFDGPDMVSNVADSSGQGNNGRLIGFISTTTVPGPIGQALSLNNGTSPYIQYVQTTTNYGNASSLTKITVSAWFKTSTASGRTIITLDRKQDGTDTVGDRTIYIGTDGRVYGYVYDTAQKYSISTNTYTDNKWHHAVAVINAGNAITLYIDGIAQSSTSIGTPYSGYSNSYWVIGNYSGAGLLNASSGVFPGKIDDVRIYNRALSAQEVQQLYNLGH